MQKLPDFQHLINHSWLTHSLRWIGSAIHGSLIRKLLHAFITRWSIVDLFFPFFCLYFFPHSNTLFYYNAFDRRWTNISKKRPILSVYPYNPAFKVSDLKTKVVAKRTGMKKYIKIMSDRRQSGNQQIFNDWLDKFLLVGWWIKNIKVKD